MRKPTITTSATVRFMRSWEYNHIEVSKTIQNEDGLTGQEIDAALKFCAISAEKAVEDAKAWEYLRGLREMIAHKKRSFETLVEAIRKEPESEWSELDRKNVEAFESFDWSVADHWQHGDPMVEIDVPSPFNDLPF